MSEPTLERADVMTELMAARKDALVIAGLGSPVWDVASSDHRLENFYLWGGMGCAAMIGLGCALAQPDRRIWVITGDGEALMGAGAFATIATQRPGNLAVIVLDNERYGETGMQRTHTSFGTDLAAMAAGAGIPTTMTITDEAGINHLVEDLQTGTLPLVAVIKVAAGKPVIVLPPRDGNYLKNRFRQAVLGATEAMHVV